MGLLVLRDRRLHFSQLRLGCRVDVLPGSCGEICQGNSWEKKSGAEDISG